MKRNRESRIGIRTKDRHGFLVFSGLDPDLVLGITKLEEIPGTNFEKKLVC